MTAEKEQLSVAPYRPAGSPAGGSVLLSAAAEAGVTEL